MWKCIQLAVFGSLLCSTQRIAEIVNLRTGNINVPMEHTEGDGEFKGHGPCVLSDVSLTRRAGEHCLWLYVYVEIYECHGNFSRQSDHTTLTGELSKWVCPQSSTPIEDFAGYTQFRRFNDREIRQSIHSLRDWNTHRYRTVFDQLRSDGFVQSITIGGDKNGEDIRANSSATIVLKPIPLQVR